LSKAHLKHLDNPFSDALILGALGKMLSHKFSALNPQEEVVLAAFKRANPKLENSSPEEIGAYLNELDESQLGGVANNVKGILHEVEYVSIENADGDSIEATMFTETNHPGTDVILTDSITGESIEIQLKATDNEAYVQEWIESHPDGEILVTEELANEMELDSSGMSNGDLTVRVDDFLDRLIALDQNSSIWAYFPELPAISIAIGAFYLVKHYQNGLIPKDQFKWMFLKMTSLQVSKFALVSALMMIPVVNLVLGSVLLTRFLLISGSHLKNVSLSN
jgi:hypothetical protein